VIAVTTMMANRVQVAML